jgi:hypothetical protein
MAALAVVGLALVSCGRSPAVADPASSAAGSPSVDRAAPCPQRAQDCLAWDDFERADGPIDDAPSGQTWVTTSLSCATCRPVFSIRDGRALMSPSAEDISIWLAMVDTGRATGLEVSATITLSPTPLRANVGLVALFVDRDNHLTCKLEMSEGHPDGLITIGEQLGGRTTSLLAERDGIGLRSGSAYRLAITVPRTPSEHPISCTVSGSGLGQKTVSLMPSGESIAAYGAGTAQGLRIKIFNDEDDGRSTWDDFLVRPI